MEGPLSAGREPSSERVVCHVDMDCFYAACERLREPALEGEPVVVGMGYEPDADVGAVATASYEAREYGVESAMPISEALERLPRKVDAATAPDEEVDEAGFYRPVELTFYESVSESVREVLDEAVAATDSDGTVRNVSIDEAYLDVSAVGWANAARFAERLRERIDEAVGVTASVGVAPNMSTAKVASDAEKPDGLVVVPPDEVESFLAPRPVDELHGVGPVTAARLAELGIETAGELADADPSTLAASFGERGRAIHRHARGIDDRAVEPVGRPKSLSSEKALSTTDDEVTKRELAERLAAEVAARAAEQGALYKTIGVKVVTPPFDVHTRERSLPGPVANPTLVEDVALDLLREFADAQVRKLGVRVSNLEFAEAEQASLTGWEDDCENTTRTGQTDDQETLGQTRFGDF